MRGAGLNGYTNSPVSDQEIIAYYYNLAIDLRNDHLSRPSNFHDRKQGYLAWKDQFTDGEPALYAYATKEPVDFNYPINVIQQD